MKDNLVKIIPRAKEKVPGYVNFLFWFSLALIVLFSSLFFVLKAKNSSLASQKANLEKKLTSSYGQTKAEKELFKMSGKIKDFSSLMKSHKKPSIVIEFLKDSCHPRVKFNILQIDLRDNKVMLNGEAESFKALGEQILSFKRSGKVKDFQISDVFLNRSGMVEFALMFTFDN